MGRRKYEIVSADVHTVEPPDVWEKHLPKKYQEHAPKLVKDHEGGDAWQFATGSPDPIGLVTTPGKRFEEFKWHGATYAEARPGVWDGKERLKDMDIDGVDAEIIFPPQRTMGHWLGNPDEELVKAGIDAYNRFHFEEFSVDRERQFPMYQIPNLGVDTSVAYLKKAAEAGAKAPVISSWPTGEDNISDADDRFWAAAVELGMPVNIHIRLIGRQAGVKQFETGRTVTSGVKKGGGSANQRAVGGMAGVFGATPPIIGQMIYTGVFDRFPDLQVVLTETGVGWIPHFVEQLDDRYWRNRTWGEINIKEPPSFYWFRNFAATFMVDFNGVAQRHHVGIENMMWSTDYPHHGNDWPYSRMRINEMFAGVDSEERYKILAGNAVRLFKLDQ
jgi:predicted TIM-barrel fold metal-dependent hydrolase